MRPIQEDMATEVSGINDSSYNSFPASPSYMQGGFAPSYPVEPEPIEPPYYVPSPFEPNPPQYQPLPIEEYRPPYQGYKPPVLEPAFPVYEVPVLEEPYNPRYKTDPVIDYPIEVVSPAPLDPIFLTPISKLKKCYNFTLTNVSNQRYDVGFTDCCTGEAVNFSLEAGESRNYLQYETTNFNTDDLVASDIIEGCMVVAIQRPTEPALTEPTPVDAIKTGVMPLYETAQYRTDVIVDPVTVTPENPSLLQQGITPEKSALPTKTSKDLKPYIIAGIAVVGILIASRLFAKK